MNTKQILTSAIICCFTIVCAAAQTPMAGDVFAAIKLDDMDTLTALLTTNKEAAVTAVAGGGITPLHYAASLNSTESVFRLLDAGMPVNLPTKGSRTTPLHWAADKGASDTLRLLLLHGADLEAEAKNGYVALHFAARSGNTEIIRYLIDADAKVDAVDQAGNTPLHLAALEGHVDTVELLVEKGASQEAKNKTGKTPLQIATGDAAEKFSPPVQKPIILPRSFDEQETALLAAAETVTPSVPITRQKDIAHEAMQEEEMGTPSEEENGEDEAETANTLVAANKRIEDRLSIGEQYRRFLNDPNTIKLGDGSLYQGEMKNGKFEGFGTLCKKDREFFQGEWHKGKRHGVGNFTYMNGDKYSGSWKNDVPHGLGVFTFAAGGEIKGVWEKGRMISGQGIYMGNDGTLYKASWMDGKMITSTPLGKNP